MGRNWVNFCIYFVLLRCDIFVLMYIVLNDVVFILLIYGFCLNVNLYFLLDKRYFIINRKNDCLLNYIFECIKDGLSGL